MEKITYWGVFRDERESNAAVRKYFRPIVGIYAIHEHVIHQKRKKKHGKTI